eukprot:g21332.t1
MKVLMVDPRPPDVSDKPDELESEAVEGEDVHPVGSVDRICEHFDDSSMELVFGAEVVVAMHPDEATDAIVDAALTAQRPFAVVPCCVFPRLFHHRRLHNGGGVVGYTGLLRFLREKELAIVCEKATADLCAQHWQEVPAGVAPGCICWDCWGPL